jgi:Zn-dependent oligopeptidase
MTRKTSLGPQIKSLLAGLAGQGNQHLTEVETDLVQTTFLLNEAIGQLGNSFLAIHEGVTKQQMLLDLVQSGASLSPEQQEKMKTIQAEIAQHVNAAVTGLQFQDITSQLISRTVKRVTGLRDVLANIGTSGDRLMPDSETEEIISVLNNVNMTLENQSVKLENVLWKAVCQTHMKSGDVELF